jgi:LysR family transcriptional regulator, regulator for bpeEF and oprC
MAASDELFNGILPFVYTAEERSFRRAAARLGVTPAAVSKAVARLEDDLGVRLLARTSRHVAITAEGAQFLERCRIAIASVQAAREVVSQSRHKPQGEVTITLPPIIGRLVVPAVARLAQRHPLLSFRLRLSDHHSLLVSEGIDVAVRIGVLEDSALVSRRLGASRWVTLGSPVYLARRGAPRHPRELDAHDCLRFLAPKGRPRQWSFRASAGGEAELVQVSGPLLVDQGEMLLEAAAAGMGLCQVLDFMVADRVREGALVEVLTEHAAEGPPIHALCLPGRAKSPNVRVVFDLLGEVFGAAPGGR